MLVVDDGPLYEWGVYGRGVRYFGSLRGYNWSYTIKDRVDVFKEASLGCKFVAFSTGTTGMVLNINFLMIFNDFS